MTAAVAFFGGYSWIIMEINANGRGPALGEYAVWLAITSVIAASLHLAPKNAPTMPDSAARSYVFLCIIVFVVTALIGGVQIRGVPRFVFDFTSTSGSAVAYSQGVSKFYGLAALFCALLARRKGAVKWSKATYLCTMVFMLVLSFLGGGRGDYLAALVMCLFALGTGRTMVLLAIFASAAYVASEYIEWLAVNSPVVARYYGLVGTGGTRNLLLSNSGELLAEEMRCIVAGCGIGYFQYYFHYPEDLYPHNLLAEGLIAFGAPVSIGLAVLAMYGAHIVYRSEKPYSVLLFVFAYFALVGMKSGSLISSYWFVGGGAYLCMRGFAVLIQREQFNGVRSAVV